MEVHLMRTCPRCKRGELCKKNALHFVRWYVIVLNTVSDLATQLLMLLKEAAECKILMAMSLMDLLSLIEVCG